jgi:hypothetical protein
MQRSAGIRDSAAMLGAELRPDLAFVETLPENYRTPAGIVQSFCWNLFTALLERIRAVQMGERRALGAMTVLVVFLPS